MDLDNIQKLRNLGGGGLVFMPEVYISEGPNICVILQCKNTPLAQLVDVDSVGFSPLCTYMSGRGKGANNRQF